MASETHTPGPWRWHCIGKDWVLWGDHGHRPIVLDNFNGTTRVRDHDKCLMVPLNPSHSDAKLIASAPELAARIVVLEAALREAIECFAHQDSYLGVETAARLNRALEAGVE